MPPKKDQKPLKGGKPTVALKDLIPPGIKQPPRDPRLIKPPEAHPMDKKTEYKSPQFPPDWPGDEQAKLFDFGIESALKFNDTTKLKTPESFSFTSSQITFWRRPKEFLLDELESQAEEIDMFSSVRRGSNPIEAKPMQKSKFRKMGTVSYSQEEFQIEDDIKVHSPKKRPKDVSVPIKVFGINERLETEEEFEKRKKDQEEKKTTNPKEAKKKPGKKDELSEDAPVMIKEVKLSNMDMSGYYPYFSKWLASQFQIIKDRNLKDAYTDKPIWTKIYPQQDGIPIYNKSGRYWVKLYYMGREKKIEIDDKMPTSVKNHCLFPRSVKKEEIWSMLFSKALLKLNSLCMEGDQEFGDGSVLYALTGLIPETMHIPKIINPEEWKYVNELVKDFHYLNNTAYVTCYCSSFYRPFAISNRMTSDKEALMQAMTFEKKLNPEEDESEVQINKQIQKDSLKMINTTSGPNNNLNNNNMAMANNNLNNPDNKFIRKTSPKKNKTTIEIAHISTNYTKTAISKEKPTYVIPGFGYSIIEAFYTEGFNMVFVQKHSEEEIKLIQDYIELSKINIHKREKEEKLEIRRKRKELREKIKEDAEKRKELIEKTPMLYKFFRVKTAIAKVPVLNVMTPFASEEIFLAKKCVLNRLKAPPNYDLPDIKMTADDKSAYSQQVSQSGESTQIKPLDDFSSLPNIKEPMKRGAGGNWILDRDFSTCFEYLQIYYSPMKLLHHKQISVSTTEDRELTNNSDCEVVVIEENQENIDPNALFQGNKIPFILTFNAYKSTTGPIVPPAYCIVQKYDFQSLDSVKNYKTLKDSMDSMHLLLENRNHVFRILTNSPLGYSIWLSCYNPFKHMSMAEYLMKYEGFANKICNVEYPALEKDRYQIFFKYKVINLEKSGAFLVIRIKTASEAFILRYLRYKLMDLKSFGNNEANTIEGVNIIEEEKSQEVLDYNKFILLPGTPYILLLESRVPFSCLEGTFELELLYKGNVTIEVLDNIEPVEYSDKYQANKYGVLFRERLFCIEEIQASIFVRLTNLVAKETNIQKSIKKPGNVPESDSNEMELTEKRLILLELFENESLLTSTSGLNFAVLSNVTLKSNKDESLNRNYYLQARFDLREFPSCITHSEDTKNLSWVLKVHSNESLAFVRDTQKEDLEKAIKKAWEDKDPGRQEKAKKARQKYLIYQKKIEGGIVTEQEMELLNEVRMSKKQRDEEQLAKQNVKMKSPTKLPEKKGNMGAKGKKEEPVVEEKKEKIIPLSKNHRLDEVKDFLELMENERIVEERAQHGGLVDVRSKENKEELKEGFLMVKEDCMSANKRNVENKEGVKSLIGESKKEFLSLMEMRKKDFNDKIIVYMKEREEIKKAITAKKEKEKILIDIGSLEKVNAEELEKLLKELENNMDIDEGLLKWGKKALINAKIINMTEKLGNAVNGFDLSLIQSCLEEIQRLTMGVDEDLIEKAGEIVEEAKNNPNYIQEKQAELKKTVGKKPAGKK